MKIKAILAAIIPLLIFIPLYGQNYYVAPAPTGSDAASGLTGAPWATLQYAVNQLAPGDVLTIEDGTYVGFYMDHVDGTAAQRITITARNRYGAVINAPPSGRGRDCEFLSCSYVTFDGFEVTLATGAGIGVRTAEYEYTGVNCRDDVIQYCHIHHNADTTAFPDCNAFPYHDSIAVRDKHARAEQYIYRIYKRDRYSCVFGDCDAFCHTDQDSHTCSVTDIYANCNLHAYNNAVCHFHCNSDAGKRRIKNLQ